MVGNYFQQQKNIARGDCPAQREDLGGTEL